MLVGLKRDGMEARSGKGRHPIIRTLHPDEERTRINRKERIAVAPGHLGGLLIVSLTVSVLVDEDVPIGQGVLKTIQRTVTVVIGNDPDQEARLLGRGSRDSAHHKQNSQKHTVSDKPRLHSQNPALLGRR